MLQNYYQFMNYYNDQHTYDLPLQPRPFFANSIITNHHQNRPKQIHNDLFRINPGKQNAMYNNHPLSHLKYVHKLQPLTTVKQSKVKEEVSKAQTAQKENKKEVLRNIINRQLFYDKNIDKKLNPIADLPKKKGEIQYKPTNRYQKLLSQVFGQPNFNKSTPKKITKINKQVREPSLKRHVSQKILNSYKSKTRLLQRHQSEAKMQQNQNTGYKSIAKQQKQKIASPTYLQLYLQKRKGVF